MIKILGLICCISLLDKGEVIFWIIFIGMKNILVCKVE